MESLERELRRGTLELLLLRILADEPTYGYELLSRLGKRSGGRFHIKEGTLYPVLYRLEDADLVEPEWEQRARGASRKVYRLTPAGETRLEELTHEWQGFAAAIESILSGQNAEEEESCSLLIAISTTS